MTIGDEKTAAALKISDASSMTSEGRRAIAVWLRRQASILLEDGDQYSSRFTARYLYRRDEEA